MITTDANNSSFGVQLPYPSNTGDTLFNNLNGINGRLPQQLVDKLKEACQRNNLKGNLDWDTNENWFDIYSNVDGKRNYVIVKDAKNGPIVVRGGSPDVMNLLREVSSQLDQK
jgi:hypothetical protein